MISDFEQWSMSLRENGYVSLQLMSEGAFAIPLTEFERLQQELVYATKDKEFLEFTTLEGNFVVVRRESVECVMAITKEYATLKDKERREELMKEL